MKNVFLLSVFSLLIFSCKQNSSPMIKTYRPPLSTEAHEEFFNMSKYSPLGKVLLHQIYNKAINEKELQNVALKKDYKDYDNNYAKLVVVSAEKDQVFFVPANSSYEWLLSNLNFSRNNLTDEVWINKKLAIGKTTYLVLTNVEDVLLNEKNYLQKIQKYSRITTLNLKDLTKYQTVELQIEKIKSNPDLVNRRDSYRSIGKCDKEVPETCYCEYEVPTASSNFTNFESLKNSESHFSLSINESSPLEQTGTNWKYDLKNEDEISNIVFNFEDSFTYGAVFKITPLNNSNCNRFNESRENITGIYRYNVDLKINGTNLTKEKWGELPKEI